MTTILDRHLALVDLVNDAPTEREHREAERFLAGFRDGLRTAGREPDLIACDFHTMEKHGEDREMCCGVLLDWKPTDGRGA